MIVPNYVPEPLEVPANVTQEPYARRLRFVRGVVFRHAVLVGLIAALALAPGTERVLSIIGLTPAAIALAALLIALELVRIARRGLPVEARASTFAIPAIVALAALVVRGLADAGVPIAAPVFGLISAWFYTALSGRDLSFVGLYVISLVVSCIVLFAWETTALGYALNAAYLLYWSYDLASLLSRRRIGEEWAAAVDLFRDVFNVFGYIPRVIRHWHRHDIWADLPRPPRGPFSGPFNSAG